MTPKLNITDKDFPLVTCEWLDANINADNLVVLDATWHMPNTARSGQIEFEQVHIKGAKFFDIDEISDKTSNLPHMVPPIDQFESQAGELGIDNSSIIIVYDTHGIFTAPRAWWHFRYMGHENVYVLDGGLKKWLAEGRSTESGQSVATPKTFKAQPKIGLIHDFEQMRDLANNYSAQMLDARSNSRFRGTEPEPRAGLRSGHIKGAKNVHYALLINDDGTLKPPAELKAIFTERKIDIEAPIVASCGSGVTACIIALSLYALGVKNTPVYDGSWSEWGSRDGAMIESDAI